jgi:hypothetical protein
MAVSACTSTVAGTPLAARGGGALTTTAAPTTNAAPAPAAAPQPPWISVGPTPPAATLGHSAIPGHELIHWRDGARKFCTVGRVVQHDSGQVGVLTAGHCAIAPSTPEQYIPTPDDGDALLATASGALDDGDSVDSAAVWIGPYQPRATISAVAGYPVDRVMPEAEVRQLPVGKATPVCIAGAMTGVRCSPLISAFSIIQFGDFSSAGNAAGPGDSGGAVFLVDRETRHATLIGLVQDFGGIASATYLEPALTRLHAQAVTSKDS